VVATLPLRNTQLREGDVVLTAPGRPAFILQGKMPGYRDLVAELAGEDVRQLKDREDGSHSVRCGNSSLPCEP
jgi:hypothetical protein